MEKVTKCLFVSACWRLRIASEGFLARPFLKKERLLKPVRWKSILFHFPSKLLQNWREVFCTDFLTFCVFYILRSDFYCMDEVLSKELFAILSRWSTTCPYLKSLNYVVTLFVLVLTDLRLVAVLRGWQEKDELYFSIALSSYFLRK